MSTATPQYVVTRAPLGDDRTAGLRRMPLDEATVVALDFSAAGFSVRVLLAPLDADEADAARIESRARAAASRRAELLASPFPLGRL